MVKSTWRWAVLDRHVFNLGRFRTDVFVAVLVVLVNATIAACAAPLSQYAFISWVIRV